MATSRNQFGRTNSDGLFVEKGPVIEARGVAAMGRVPGVALGALAAWLTVAAELQSSSPLQQPLPELHTQSLQQLYPQTPPLRPYNESTPQAAQGHRQSLEDPPQHLNPQALRARQHTESQATQQENYQPYRSQQLPQQPYPQSPLQPYPQSPLQPYPQSPLQQYPQYPQQPYLELPQQQYPQSPQQLYPQSPHQPYPQSPLQQYPQSPQRLNLQSPQQPYLELPQQQYPQSPQQYYPQSPHQPYPESPRKPYPQSPQRLYPQALPQKPYQETFPQTRPPFRCVEFLGWRPRRLRLCGTPLPDESPQGAAYYGDVTEPSALPMYRMERSVSAKGRIPRWNLSLKGLTSQGGGRPFTLTYN
ncbi:hypothetical protein AAG570_000640 [Ranatra chinensis]|uniref:Uncharacterized protein n=1 Tax=Ranatra chinensis TaxID=642074 RepID=A0ABD0YXY3_9HEMI